MERQPRGLADDLQELLRRADPRHLHQDAVAALALDRRLAGAGLIDPAADDLEALLQRPRVERRLLRVGQRHHQLVALGPRLELAGAGAGDREDRLRRVLRRLEGGLHAGRVADPDPQLLRPAVQPPDAAHLVAQVAQLVADARPEPLQLLGMHVLGLHLNQHVRSAAQVEPEADQPVRQPRRPGRRVGEHLRRQRLALLRREPRVVRPLDPAIEEVGQCDDRADQADRQNEKLLPVRVRVHLDPKSPGGGAAGRPALRPRGSGLGGLGLAHHLAEGGI